LKGRVLRADGETHIQAANHADNVDGDVRTARVIAQVFRQYFFATIVADEAGRNAHARHLLHAPEYWIVG
jgi:hypothetical protein